MGESGFNCWVVKGPVLVLFMFYVNVSGMHQQSRLSSQPLTIMAPWVFLRIRLSIPLVPPWVTSSRFLSGNMKAELKLTAFTLLLLFCVFLSFLFSKPPAI